MSEIVFGMSNFEREIQAALDEARRTEELNRRFGGFSFRFDRSFRLPTNRSREVAAAVPQTMWEGSALVVPADETMQRWSNWPAA